MGTDERDFFEQAADAYDDILVPAIFDPWAAEVTRRMGDPGGTAVDVACGTGVLAGFLLDAGWTHVIGVDLSWPMLERAADRTPEAEWVQGDALELPLDDGVADGLASSFGLMFMPDPSAALAEMGRVTRSGGPVVVSTWLGFDECPGIGAVMEAVQAVGGPKSTELFQRGFAMNDADELGELGDDAGLHVVGVSRYEVEAVFNSVDDLATTYATSLALGDPASEGALKDELVHTLAPWMRGDEVVFPMAGLILEARA